MNRPVVASIAFFSIVALATGSTASQAGFPPIDGEAILQHIKVLSSSRFEGRAPGTKGEELTVEDAK